MSQISMHSTKRKADHPELSATVTSEPNQQVNFPVWDSVHKNSYPLFVIAILLPLFFLAACGPSTETIVVGGEARTIEAEDEAAQEDTITDDLRVLKIGEVNRIRSFDPLFAVNNATRRAILLSYEGLVRFNENDEVVPAAARRWEVSDDSLTYTFTLRRDLFFHDDESFTQGRGRKVNSRDVVSIFERMASRDVPSAAAELFIDEIRGFEAFYLEQQDVYFAGDREIRNISGMEAPNDSTVVFHLQDKNRHFTMKLASPYAVIYPQEPFRFRDDGLHRHAVGTGPFKLNRSVGDSLFIFLRNNTYYGKDDQGRRLPRVHRVELLNITDETRLYSRFTRGQLHMIVELGPLSVHTVVDEHNRLKEQFQGTYRLESRPNPDPVILQYNSRNRFGLGRSDAAAVIRNLDSTSIRQDLSFPSLRITYKDDSFTQSNVGRVFRRFAETDRHRLLFAYHQDHLPRTLGGSMYSTINDNLRRDFIQRRTFSRDIFLYLDYLATYIPGERHERQPQELMRIETDRFMIFDNQTEGIRTNSLSWWINLNHARIRDNEMSSMGARHETIIH